MELYQLRAFAAVADAGQLRATLTQGAGIAVTIPSGFGDETLGWFIGLTPEPSRAICVVLEDSNAAAAAATALRALRDDGQ